MLNQIAFNAEQISVTYHVTNNVTTSNCCLWVTTNQPHKTSNDLAKTNFVKLKKKVIFDFIRIETCDKNRCYNVANVTTRVMMLNDTQN